MILVPVDDEGTTSPYTRFPSSANHSKNDAAYATSPRDSIKGLPCSAVMILAKSSAFASTSSNHRLITFPRACALNSVAHTFCASSLRLKTSEIAARGVASTVASVAFVAGFFTSNVSLARDAPRDASVALAPAKRSKFAFRSFSAAASALRRASSSSTAVDIARTARANSPRVARANDEGDARDADAMRAQSRNALERTRAPNDMRRRVSVGAATSARSTRRERVEELISSRRKTERE
jgi:hypothetical protein